MEIKNQTRNFIILLVVLLFFLRIDYRFKTTVECCSDEYDYFLHASTIVYDFDFDYDNQNLRDFSYKYGEKIAPIGFVGTGILSSPFLFMGKLLTNIFNQPTSETIMNYEFLLYSFSSVVYFFLSYFILLKLMSLLQFKLNKYKLLLYFSASGLPYYAFERFGMTHVFEVFTILLLTLTVFNFYENTKLRNIYAFLIPLILLISFLTRMSNFFVFFIPLIIKKIYISKFKIKKITLISNFYFLVSSILSILVFRYLSISIYGRIIINPQQIYGDTRDPFNIFKNFDNLFLDATKTFINILFTNEFGIFWMSPIIFLGICIALKNLKNFKIINNWLILISFAQCFYIVYLWKTTASSYGFRYLYPLIPLSFILYFLESKKSKYFESYIFYFSILGILGVLFFETTLLTQLSTTPQLNTFGKDIRYVEPEYVKGLLLALFNLESYYIIFTTSFFGATVFKILLILFGENKLINFLNFLKLPVENDNFQNYIDNLTMIGIDKFIFSIIILVIFTYIIVYKIDSKT